MDKKNYSLLKTDVDVSSPNLSSADLDEKYKTVMTSLETSKDIKTL